jgi:hypothetical protein
MEPVLQSSKVILQIFIGLVSPRNSEAVAATTRSFTLQGAANQEVKQVIFFSNWLSVAPQQTTWLQHV